MEGRSRVLQTSLNASDFYTNQHETPFCHFVLEKEEKTGSGNVTFDSGERRMNSETVYFDKLTHFFVLRCFVRRKMAR